QGLLWRFQREASISAMLEHPNIVPLHDVQKQSNGEMFFTMRKIEGKTLREILGRKRQNSQEYEEVELLSIFLKVCDAIAYAHSKGVIHRDLKPENIMVGQFGEVYVMDWGIAKILKNNPQELIENVSQENSEEDNRVKKTPEELIDSIETETLEEAYNTVGGIGTEGYMAPEQRENASQISSVADIYALGKILRECYTLLSPIEEFQLLLKQGSEKLKKPDKKELKNEHSVEENFSLDIQAIVKKATNENSSERYQKVEEISKDIQQYQKNKRVSARKYNFIDLLFRNLIPKISARLVLFIICLSFFIFCVYILIAANIKKESWNQKEQEIYAFEKAIVLTKENDLSALILNLKDKNWLVRFLVARDLGNTDKELEQIILSLIETLGDENQYVRRVASISLMKIAQKSTEVIPQLIQSL
ncbi:MAG: protein kinase, partial [Planctomycetota bacterium]